LPHEIAVRTGTPADVHRAMDLALAACADNGLTNPNPVKLLGEIWAALNLDNGIMGLIGGDKLEAGILLRIDKMWYSDDKTLLERAIFVRPEFRRSGEHKVSRVKLLVDFAKNAQKQLDLPLVIGILSNQRSDAKVRLYQRHFGEPAGAYWLYGAKTGPKPTDEPTEPPQTSQPPKIG
jgi:hypothetical protein